MASNWRVASDIGSTFTDIALYDGDTREVRVVKVPSTPQDHVAGLISGLRRAAPDASLGKIGLLIHGTTVATNVLAGGSLPKVVLFATSGFGFVLEMGKKDRSPEPYNLFYTRPRPLVPRERVFEVSERITATGDVIKELDTDSTLALIRDVLEKERPDAIAVSLFHSYANPVNELALARLIREVAPSIYVSLSSDVDPQVREYERTVTTVLNALAAPTLVGYVARLEAKVRQSGISAPIYMAQANGGLASVPKIIERPIASVQATHAGSLRLAASMAQRSGIGNLAVIDMGGASFDVGFVSAGEPVESTETTIAGFPARLSVLQSRSIGAGGGSIARLDGAGALRVGPDSAGSDPGPACYGRGGELPTATDANVVLGRLSHETLAVGAGVGALHAARKAVDQHVATPLGVTTEDAALGILRVLNASMGETIRGEAIALGFDIRDFWLFAVGGAGPLHAADLCDEVGAKGIVVPANSALGSALGYLASDFRHDLSSPVNCTLDDTATLHLVAEDARLRDRGEKVLGELSEMITSTDVLHRIGVRYKGQGYALSIPWNPEHDTAATISKNFDAEHMRVYGHENSSAPKVVDVVRCSLVGRLPRAEKREAMPVKLEQFQVLPLPPPKAERPVWAEPGEDPPVIPVVPRSDFRSQCAYQGPVIVEEADTTTYIPVGYSMAVDLDGNLVIAREFVGSGDE